jgi:hypothetical protein
LAKQTPTPAERQAAIAHQIYLNRQLLKRAGSAEQDWQTADDILAKPYKRALFGLHKRLIGVEKRVWEPLLRWADNQALISLLGVVGNIGILIAVVSYVGGEKQRRDAEVLNAWQTLTSSYGQSGSGGRIQALEFLNASPGANWRRRFPWFCAPLSLCTWPQESLAGINLSTEDEQGVYLEDINLERAVLEGANLKGADLKSANLKGAILWNANLEGTHFDGANLEGAHFGGANLKGAILWAANLEGAVLWAADLEGAVLVDANLKGTIFCQTILPEGIEIDPDRDCEALGITPD